MKPSRRPAETPDDDEAPLVADPLKTLPEVEAAELGLEAEEGEAAPLLPAGLAVVEAAAVVAIDEVARPVVVVAAEAAVLVAAARVVEPWLNPAGSVVVSGDPM